MPDVDAGLIEPDPPRFLMSWSANFSTIGTARSPRLLISLATRDGLVHSDAFQEAMDGMRRYLADLFAGWIAAGQIPDHLGPGEQLAFSFTGPIGLARVLHLHADASVAADPVRLSASFGVRGESESG